MDPNANNPNGDIQAASSAPPAALPCQVASSSKPGETALSPTMSPADVRFCTLGGYFVGWFVFILGLVSALGSAWLLYLGVRWIWFGGLARWLGN